MTLFSDHSASRRPRSCLSCLLGRRAPALVATAGLAAAGLVGSLAAATPASASTTVGQLAVIAGTGTAGAPMPGMATSSKLHTPYGVAVDSSGNVYIADSTNNRIERVSTSGQLSVFAGTGTAAAPMAGPATTSDLNHPTGVAVDSSGNLYIADSGNNDVEEVTSTGTLSVIAGTGTPGQTFGGQATTAPLNDPTGVAVDSSGNVYIADPVNNQVYEVTASSGAFSVVAGAGDGSGMPSPTGPATGSFLNTPTGVAVDSSGNVYIADSGNDDVEEVTPAGTLSIVAGHGFPGAPTGGPALSSPLNDPTGVAVDSSGDLYIADSGNNDVEEVTPAGTLSVLAGTGVARAPTDGPAASSDLNGPSGVAADSSGDVYIADSGNNDVEEIAPTPPVTVPGAPTIGTATGGNAQATVAFTAPVSDGGSAITGYTVTADDTTTGTASAATATGATSPITVTGLTNGDSYTFSVVAANTAGASGASAASNVITPAAPVTVPGAPTIGTATGGNAQATVAFTAPVSDGGSAITGYTVTADDTTTGTASAATATGATSPITVTGLTNGDSYTFSVVAANTAGASGASAASNVITPAAPVTVPGAPTIGSATGGNAQATVAFTAPVSDGGSAITGYTVTADDTTTGTASAATATGATSPITVTGLTDGDSYTFSVVAANTAGASVASAASNTVIPAAPVVPPMSTVPVFSADSPPAGTVGVAYSYRFVASGSPAPTFGIGSGVLPAGLSLDSTTGVLSGTPTGSGSFTVTATNAAGTVTSASITITVTTPPTTPPTVPPVTTPPSVPAVVRVPTGGATAATSGGAGYWALTAGGILSAHGNAIDYGSENGAHLAAPVVGIASTPDGNGYWEVAADGGVFSFGDAVFYGSMGAAHLNQPVVGMASTPDGRGYWLVAADGGVFSFGDAVFYGSLGGVRLNQPVVGLTATPDGKGYWLVGADGGVFSFGDAVFYGSLGGVNLNKHVVGIAATPDGNGYWLVGADGGVFTFGDAVFYGSLGATGTIPIVGIVANNNLGYRLIGPQGDTHPYGTTP